MRKMIIRTGAIALATIVVILLLLYGSDLLRLYRVINLFEPDRIVYNFRNMDALFGARTVRHDGSPTPLRYAPAELPAVYSYNGVEKKTAAFIDRTWTTGLMVIRDDRVTFEKYYRGANERSRFISWSMVKSMVSALVGIAVREGRIKDIRQPVTDYVPSLKGSGYDGVPIKDILQMSSGVKFNEDYGDFNADINRLGRILALRGSLDEFAASLRSERKPGIYNHYVSIDTQVLGMLLREATGMPLSRYLEERLWKPAGMEADARWITDGRGMEIAFGGLNAVLRDYARFGLLYLHNGVSRGNQLVPAAWIRASITPDAPHLRPGKRPNSGWVLGYGYQWWLPENPEGDYLAIGVYNQFIYIHPGRRVVIVKTSAYPHYTRDGEDTELESIALFRAIAKSRP